ncbi:MAG: acetyl-CoA carboxylase biotin carboxyl carrier protein subunit [Desulfosporosinus sp. BRH_c37]|nr:MAG: acetyl-CoA carboxylase biotin carboxyl carrier protein subunit [Desulfosporosinus sp. BRH_c37]
MAQVISTVDGLIAKINVNVGEQIEEGQELVILHSMKMEIPIFSEVDGVVSEITIPEGDKVSLGDVILVVS